MRIACFLFGWLIVFAATFSTAASWIPVGPPGGEPARLVPDRRNPKLWYTAQDGVLYKTTDGARTWRPGPEAIDVLYIGPADSAVFVLRYDKNDHLYYAYKSTDRGVTFQRTNSWADAGVVFSRIDARYAYVVTGDHEYTESTDGGETWIARHPALTSSIDLNGCKLGGYKIVELTVGPTTADTLSLSVQLPGCTLGTSHSAIRAAIAVSQDRGSTWSVTYAAEPENEPGDPFRFKADPDVPNIYAVRLNGDLASWQGISWHSHLPVPCQRAAVCRLQQLIQSLRSPTELIVTQVVNNNDGSRCRVLLSASRGWSPDKADEILCNISAYQAVYAMQDAESDFVFSDYNGLGFRRIKNGRLIDANAGFAAKLPLLHPCVNGKRVYALAGSSQISLLYTSQDGGKTWEELRIPFSNGALYKEIEISPHDPSVLLMILGSYPLPDSAGFYHSTYFVYRTTDSGKFWSRCLQTKSQIFPTPIAFDWRNPGIVYFSIGCQLYRSTLNGNLPTLISSIPAIDLVVDRFDSNRLYATTCRDLLRSEDSGSTFMEMSKGLHRLDQGCDAVYIASLPEPNHYLVQNDINEMLLTENGGRNWARISQVPTSHGGGSYRPPGAIRFFPRGKKQVFAATHLGTYESGDGGLTWSLLLNSDQPVWDMSDPRLGPLYLASSTLLKEHR